jgi:hypothetical protein
MFFDNFLTAALDSALDRRHSELEARTGDWLGTVRRRQEWVCAIKPVSCISLSDSTLRKYRESVTVACLQYKNKIVRNSKK